jgi:hypothetical protein
VLTFLFKLVEENTTGMKNKKATIFVTLCSGVIFLILGFFLISFQKNNKLIALFLSEAVGQLFLALENIQTIKENHIYKYFNQNCLGKLAGLSFLITAVTRLILCSSLFLKNGLLDTFLIILFIVLYSGGFIMRRIRLDAYWGSFIFLTSIVSSVIYFYFGNSQFDFYFFINQLAYSLILIVGVLKLRPWIAESINILIWIHLFLICFH